MPRLHHHSERLIRRHLIKRATMPCSTSPESSLRTPTSGSHRFTRRRSGNWRIDGVFAAASADLVRTNLQKAVDLRHQRFARSAHRQGSLCGLLSTRCRLMKGLGLERLRLDPNVLFVATSGKRPDRFHVEHQQLARFERVATRITGDRPSRLPRRCGLTKVHVAIESRHPPGLLEVSQTSRRRQTVCFLARARRIGFSEQGNHCPGSSRQTRPPYRSNDCEKPVGLWI